MVLDLVGLFIHLAVDDLFRITGHSDVGIMCNNNHLPALFGPANAGHQFAEDRLVVQIILRLINDNGLTLLAERKIKYEEHDPAFTWGELGQIAPSHFELEIDVDIVKAKNQIVKALTVNHFLTCDIKVLSGRFRNLVGE